MNTDELEHALLQAERRVLKIQTKLHRWACDDPHRRFDDLFNLVADPGFLLAAWDRVAGNKGARTAGVDGRTARSVEAVQGVEGFLDQLRSSLKDRGFRPVPVRERMIPKAGGKLRRLGIPTVADRVVQAALKLVLEPIFEADFLSCSYGFRPKRRAHDAVAEVRRMDVVDDFAYPLPVSLICTLLGIPTDDEPTFKRWTTLISSQAAPTPDATEEDQQEIDRASGEALHYMIDLAQRRKKDPATT